MSRLAGDVVLTEFYAGDDKGWTKLRRNADYRLPPPGPEEPRLARSMGRLLHINDAERFRVWRELLANQSVQDSLDLTIPDHRLLMMLATRLNELEVRAAPDALRQLLAHKPLAGELTELLDILEDAVRREGGRGWTFGLSQPDPGNLQSQS